MGCASIIKLFESITEENRGKFSVPVDLIRVTAIFLVIFLHVTNTFHNQIYEAVLNGTFSWTFTIYKSLALPCVPLFVMLTGSLLLQPSKINEPIKVFLKKRVKRIGLAFLFWTAVYLVWSFYITQTPFTFVNILEGTFYSLFSGSYYHFWYLYLIAGLYLITPLLRASVAFKDPKLIKYLILVWFIGISLVPLLPVFTNYSFPGGIFIMGGYSGYFLLGHYLQNARLRRKYMYGFIGLGLIFTVASTWVMSVPLEPLKEYYVFFDYLAVNVVVMSIGLYAFLSSFPADWPGGKHPKAKKIVRVISKNTLPIFLFHIIILETLHRGLLGFTLDLTIFPLLEIPLAAIFILLVTLGLILIMKKVPILKKLIG